LFSKVTWALHQSLTLIPALPDIWLLHRKDLYAKIKINVSAGSFRIKEIDTELMGGGNQ